MMANGRHHGGQPRRSGDPSQGGQHHPGHQRHQMGQNANASQGQGHNHIAPIPSDTRQALGLRGESCNFRLVESRSLVFDRFANPYLKEDARREFFTNHMGIRHTETEQVIRHRRLSLINEMAGAGFQLKMELRSRLVLNASGGVMENAGLCLDRFSNLPYIPGSAVKGCARRTAIYFLREWRQSGKKPDQLTGDLAEYKDPHDLMRDIALMFGWVDQDFKEKQDFDWAWGESWKSERDVIAETLLSVLGHKIDASIPAWKQLPAFEGTVSFLSAWPGKSPSQDLELDVVTCHHRKYYDGERGYENAPDCEEPVPVVFPTVAPGHIFLFGVYPVHRALPNTIDAMALAKRARAWLKLGLEVFGLGGKTAAGYGWFAEPSDREQQANLPLGAPVRTGDFNDREIQNLIKQALNKSQWNNPEFKKKLELLKKPENDSWKKVFVEETRSNKELTKQPWYPK